MKLPRAAAIAAIGVVCAVLSGCDGPPDPVASTPLFSSEEEAFAAAEQTYRNYVDALNQVDLSDPETFEAVYAWTTGDANAADRQSFSQMHADELTVSGKTRAAVVEPVTPSLTTDTVDLAVCLDVSDVKLLDPTGESAVDEGRKNLQSMLVSLSRHEPSSTGWLIETFSARKGEPVCDTE